MAEAEAALGAIEPAEIRQRQSSSPIAQTFRRLLRKKIAMIAIFYLIIFYGAGFFAPLIAPQDPYQQNISRDAIRQAPSSGHLLGTDSLGRDLASRVIYSARTTAIFTLVVSLTGGLFLGLGLGLLAGYRGGWVDTLIMRVGEVMSGLPTLFIMLALMAAFRTRINDLAFDLKENTFLGNDARSIVQFLIIAAVTVPFSWLGSCRIVRAQALYLREAQFVQAAEQVGASTWWTVSRHILPGVMPLFVVGVTAGMSGLAGAEVALSFLGLGITEPTPSFGNLIGEGAGLRTFQQFPHLLVVTSVPVILFFFAWNLLGDALVDILEPRTVIR